MADVAELKQEYTHFMENMSCLSMMKLEYKSRCEMSKILPHCNIYTNFINYFKLMYCTFDIRDEVDEISVLVLFFFVYWLLFCIIFLGTNQYYLPALKIAAIRLRMNEYLAGVILVGVANSTSDFLLNLSAVRSQSPTLNIAMSSALTSICVSGGAICYIMPFKMNGSSLIRDFLYIILIIQLIRVYTDSSVPVYYQKAISIILAYPLYLAINIIDLVLMRYNIRKLRREINVLRYEPTSPELDLRMYRKVQTLTDLEEDDNIKLLRMKVRRGIFHAGVFVTPKPLTQPKKVDVETNRSVLHSSKNPKNRFLFTEFFEDLNPIDPEEWSLSGKYGRTKIICKAPVSFILRLTIPKVNYDAIKHGWSKLLNCLQIVINPFIVLLLTETMFYKTGNRKHWFIHCHYRMALWSMVVTVPLSTVVFIHSRTDIPPFYHILFAVSTVVSVVILVWICAWEMEVIVSIIGIVFNLSSNYMTVSFNAMSNAIPDMVAYVHLAQNGFGKMAFGGIIGGAVFNLIFNTGVQFASKDTDYTHLLGDFGEIIFIFLMLTIGTTMWWCWTFNFHARRSGGIFLWCLFAVFLLYATLIELKVINDFTEDLIIELRS